VDIFTQRNRLKVKVLYKELIVGDLLQIVVVKNTQNAKK